jgi:hypothetical protein
VLGEFLVVKPLGKTLQKKKGAANPILAPADPTIGLKPAQQELLLCATATTRDLFQQLPLAVSGWQRIRVIACVKHCHHYSVGSCNNLPPLL